MAREIVSNIAAGLLGLRSTATVEAPPALRQVEEKPTEASPKLDEPKEEPAEISAEQPDEEEVITLDEPYIETPRCTTCNECTNLNSRMFAYDENKQAYIKDLSAGTFRELVLAAEKCPVRIIHPGKPLNPDEPGLADLIKRAQPFQ